MSESDNQKNVWNGQNVPHGAFGNMLERMTNQFTPNHGSQHYQSGFIPATTPAWTSHAHNQVPMTYAPQHNQSHNMGIDPALSVGALNSPRSFSVSQDPYPDASGNRTPLLRSSSDLGIRMNHYPSSHGNFSELDGIIDHQVEEPLDSAVFYSDGSHLNQARGNPIHINNVHSFQHIQTSNAEILRTKPTMHYGSYGSQESNAIADVPENNFATKLSNFTASLGTWFSPLPVVEQSQNSFAGSSEVVDVLTNLRPKPTIDNSSLESHRTVSGNPRTGRIALATKPSYSDVLSKAPSQECKGNSISCSSSSSSTNKSYNFPSTSHQKNRGAEPSLRTTGGGKSKGRNSTASGGRSSSPITNVSVSSNSNKQHSNAGASKNETNLFSKVGLDDFDLPENISRYSCSYMNNLNNNSKSCNVESFDRSKKRSSLTSEDSSPAHQPKKGNRNEKKSSDKVEDSPVSSDMEKSQCDKLNNHTLSSQPKQTPKRTTYINNDLASPSFGNKTSNSESSQYSLNRKNNTAKEDFKLQNKYDDVSYTGINKTPSTNSSILNPGSFSNYSNNRSKNRGSGTGRSTDKKDNSSKKNYGKRKKETASYHSELVMTGWTMFCMWMGMAAKAGLWLIRLFLDVVQMSWRLSVDYGLQLFANGKLQWKDVKLCILGYCNKLFSFFWRNKADTNKKGGRGDRKSTSGLEAKIPLPTTGDEAMKRLLACRGKDPYNILGVTHESSDDDIKKYYKRQAFLVHPDKNKQPGAEEAFKILAHAFEIIGEPEKREQYDTKLAEEVHFEGAWGELTSLLNSLKEKLEEAANTIRCTNCNKRHKRVKLPRPTYAARHCAECQIKHAAKEGDIWAESWLMGLRWKYYACMEGAIYDISEWAACQRDNLKHLQANTHSVQYRIVSGKKNAGGKANAPECPTDPELEEFFNNLCRERFGQDFVTGGKNSSTNSSSDARKRKGKKKK